MFASCVWSVREYRCGKKKNPPCFLCDIRVLYRDIVHTSSHQGQFPISWQTIERDWNWPFSPRSSHPNYPYKRENSNLLDFLYMQLCQYLFTEFIPPTTIYLFSSVLSKSILLYMQVKERKGNKRTQLCSENYCPIQESIAISVVVKKKKKVACEEI
jgi:hypothetical protein